MLYPKMTSSRMVFDLSGVWEFKLLDEEGTEREAAGNRLQGVGRPFAAVSGARLNRAILAGGRRETVCLLF